jgi:hypothetical protein
MITPPGIPGIGFAENQHIPCFGEWDRKTSDSGKSSETSRGLGASFRWGDECLVTKLNDPAFPFERNTKIILAD